MQNKAFVICCKESNHIHDCVKSIRNFYPDDHIYIVDSCSDDKSYFSLKDAYSNIYIEDICNKNYEYGAFLKWFNKYGDQYDTYVFMQDSIRLNLPITELDEIQDNEVFLFHGQECGWTNDQPAKECFYSLVSDEFPRDDLSSFAMTNWNSFIIKRDTFFKLIESKIFKDAVVPDNKLLSQAWERVWSMVFKYNNITIKRINYNQINKIWGARA